jgi:hypothetical protein
LKDNWTTIETWFCSRQVSDPKGMLSMMKPGY